MITVDGDVYLCTSGQCLSMSGVPADQAAPIPFAGFFAAPDALVDQFPCDVPAGLDIGRFVVNQLRRCGLTLFVHHFGTHTKTLPITRGMASIVNTMIISVKLIICLLQ